MNRRSFLTGLATLIGGAALDPERLLWVPGKKLISIPKPAWTDLYPPRISNEMLMNWLNPAIDILDERIRREIIQQTQEDLLVSQRPEPWMKHVRMPLQY